MYLVWALSLFLQTQNATDQQEYIVLDVVARDAKGELVGDLTSADFMVRDGRKKVALTHFDVIDFQAETAKQNAGIEAGNLDPIQQTLILLLDQTAITTGTIKSTLMHLQSYLDTLRDRDDLQMFVFSMDVGLVSTQFTTNAQEVIQDLIELKARLAQAEQQAPNKSTPGRGLASLEAEMSNCFTSNLVSSQQFNRSRSLDGPAGVRTCLENAYRIFANNQQQFASNRVTVLERFLKFLARVPGLKTVYLVSPGWPYQSGEAAFRLSQSFADYKKKQIFSGSSGNINSVRSEKAFSAAHFQTKELSAAGRDLESEYKRLSHLALRNRIILHTFLVAETIQTDHKRVGLSSNIGIGVDNKQAYDLYEKEQEKGLSELARLSGGTHCKTAELGDSLKETLETYRQYYVLAYAKPASRKQKFRKLTIKCKRPGITLHHHSGYFSNFPEQD